MTKRLKSKHKVDRRLRSNIWGRPKSPFNSRAYPPGQHGQNKKGKPTDYGIQLQAKQKLKEHKIATQQEPVYNEDGSSSYKYAAHITLGDIQKFQRGQSL